MKIISELDRAIGRMIAEFEIKQDFHFSSFIGDDCLGLVCFDDYYTFSVSDILYDLKTKQEKGKIIEYFNDSLDAYQEGKKHINYRSYCMGARFENTEDDETTND